MSSEWALSTRRSEERIGTSGRGISPTVSVPVPRREVDDRGYFEVGERILKIKSGRGSTSGRFADISERNQDGR